jgi:hypothetical protein
VSPVPLEWTLNAIPDGEWAIPGRPTAHISLDSTQIDPELLSDIEDLIYGTDETDPELPSLLVLQAMAAP